MAHRSSHNPGSLAAAHPSYTRLGHFPGELEEQPSDGTSEYDDLNLTPEQFRALDDMEAEYNQRQQYAAAGYTGHVGERKSAHPMT